MATRSNVSIKFGSQYYVGYCHHDSYLVGVGLTLHLHYKNPVKTMHLINKGAVSGVHKTLGECAEMQHVLYPNNNAGGIYPNVTDYRNAHTVGIAYCYNSSTRNWWYRETYKHKWVLLSDALKNEGLI